MTTLALPRQGGALKTVFARMGDFFAGIQEGLAMAREYDTLSRLTPAELARLGIRREDIPRIVARRLIKA